MNQLTPEVLLAQILPVLNNPRAFESFLNQAPLTQKEKDTIRQICRQFTNPQSTPDSLGSLDQVIRDLMARINPDQLQSLAPLLEQISKMPPEQLKAIQKLLGINK